MKINESEEFEEYLKEVHGEQYRGLDDDMSDDYQEWRSELSSEEIKQFKKDWKIKK